MLNQCVGYHGQGNSSLEEFTTALYSYRGVGQLRTLKVLLGCPSGGILNGSM